MKHRLRIGKPVDMSVTERHVPKGHTDPSIAFLSDSQDVESLKEHLGNKPCLNRFDSFFVRVGDGEYTDIWGMEGTVPFLSKPLYRISQSWS